MKRFFTATLALMFTASCQAGAPTGARRPVATKSTAPVSTASQRVVGVADPVVSFAGVAKIISDNGLGVISNNSGGIISNNSSGIISDNGLGYRTLAVRGESLLADAVVQVLDAQGKVLVGADKKPLTATTDKKGAYSFKARLPDENLVLRIRLFNGGTLSALLTRPDGDGARKVDLDTASTLSAQYVLTKYVKGDKAVYARLPAAEAAKLRDEMAEAVKGLDKAPSYQDDALVAAAESLRGQSKTLDAQLTRIQDLLLLGQSNLGAGRPADSVGITNPVAVYRDAAGVTYIAESLSRIRRVDKDGKISLYGSAKPVSGGVDGALGLISDMAGQPDGTLYVALYADKRVVKIDPKGKLTTVAGGGTSTASSGAGTDLQLGRVHRVALGAKGVVYLCERTTSVFKGRVLKMTADGQCQALPPLRSADSFAQAFGLAEDKDGTLYAFVTHGADDDGHRGIDRLKPGATAWESWLEGPGFNGEERMGFGPDGKLYFGNCVEGRLYRTSTAGAPAPEIVAGGGTPFVQDKPGPFDVVRGFWVGADGSALVVNGSKAIINAVSPDGQVSRFAGVEGATTVGDGLGLALNGPMAIAKEAGGDFVFTENNRLVKRLKGQTVELIKGDLKLGSVAAIYPKGNDLYMADSAGLICKLGADGQVTQLAGHGEGGMMLTRRVAAKDVTFGKVAGLVVDGKGRVWWTDSTHHQLLRLDTDGQVTLVGGALGKPGNLSTPGDTGDGGPAAEALFNGLGGLAVDAQDNVYVADAGNGRIRKIDAADTITSYAGIPRTKALGKLLSGTIDMGEVKAADALFVGPAALCFGPDGALYVGELGTIALKIAGSVASGDADTLPIAIPDTPSRVRKISPSGMVSVVAGPGGKALTDPDADDGLYSATSLAFDGQGRLAIVDTATNQIKVLPAGTF